MIRFARFRIDKCGSRSQWRGACAAVALLLAGPAFANCELAIRVDYAKDYRAPQSASLIQNVEINHFTPSVELLIQPKWRYFGSDIQYMLERIPNHPRALASMARLVEREKNEQPEGATVDIGCQFQRAFEFVPDDLTPRLIYADYLTRRKQTELALGQLNFIVKHAGDDPFAHFNAGLIYTDLKAYDLALKQAHHALALGMNRPLLRDRLVAAGRWRDPTEAELQSWARGEDPDAPAPAPAEAPASAPAASSANP